LNLAEKYSATPTSIRRMLKENGVPLRMGQGNSIYHCNEDFFEEINTEEKAYWLGFLYADGCISITKYSYYIILSLKGEECEFEHLKKFNASLESTYPIKIYKFSDAYGEREKVQVALNSKKLAKDLINKGCTPRKSLILNFPTEEQVPLHLINHFVRGYFDGDGSIYKNTCDNQYNIGIIGTLEFLNKLKELTNITTKLSTKENHKNTYNFRIGGNKKTQKFLDWLYKDSTVSLSRKKERYEALKTYNEQRTNSRS
jgi:intein-encoded DNA endonuclease-like protein